MKELIQLFSAIELPSSSKSYSKTNPVEIFNKELSVLGYTLDKDGIEKLKHSDKFDFVRNEALGEIAELKGASYRYDTLFNNFPYKTPNQYDYLQKRIEGYFNNLEGRLPNQNFTSLSCGHVIDHSVFDPKDFGACPICQFQVDELNGDDNVKYAFKNITPLKLLKVVDRKFMIAKAQSFFDRGSSLSETERNFLEYMHSTASQMTAPTGKVFKETLPYVYKYFGVEAVRPLLSGATDVMRIATYLSSPGGDLSLKENTKFILNSSAIKKLLSLLDGLPNIQEDLLRDRERWLRLGEILHPNSAKNASRFPRVAGAFIFLRNDPAAIPSYNREVEKTVRSNTIDTTFLNLAASRPGEFARRFDHLIRSSMVNSTTDEVLNVFVKNVAPKLNNRISFGLLKYLAARNRVEENRVFFPKGNENRVKVLLDNRVVIPSEIIDKARNHIYGELLTRMKTQSDLGKVYVDPALNEILVPFNKRGDSSASTSFSKGSRIPVNDKAKVMRMFCWWKGNIDVDLSAIGYDADMNIVYENYWSDTENDGMKHSGDIQRAPKGASEFIDLNIAKLKKAGVRYVTLSVISYTGEHFNSFPCFAGFMERDSMTAGKKYEPQSVNIKIDIVNNSTSTIPLMFDITDMKMIVADMSSGGGRYQTIGDSSKLKILTSAMLNLVNTKPTLGEVFMVNSAARGFLVNSPDKADIVYLASDPDIFQKAEEILNES